MPPTVEATERQRAFAAQVLAELLHIIEVRNANADPDLRKGRYIFYVSHAWTEGSMMYLVYTVPESDRTWGLARDTRKSLIGFGPWDDTDDPALYYYLLELEECWPGRHNREPGEPDIVWWDGDPLDDCIEQIADRRGQRRYTSPPVDPPWINQDPPVVNETRRYADRRGPCSCLSKKENSTRMRPVPMSAANPASARKHLGT